MTTPLLHGATTRDQVVDAVLLELLGLKDPPEKAPQLAEDIADRLGPWPTPASPAADVECYDLIAEQDYVYPGGKRKARTFREAATGRRRPVLRHPRAIDGIVLHQTAVEYGVSTRQVQAAGGDRRLALARRGRDVACHSIAFRAGLYVRAHPLRAYVNHGNELNQRSLGLEVDGRYAGLEDKPETAAREDLLTTWRGPPTRLAELTIETARAALRDLVERGRAEDMPIEFLWAHRQSSAMRRSDPGEALWDAIAPWAERELSLKTQPGLAVGNGRPLPVEWHGGRAGY